MLPWLIAGLALLGALACLLLWGAEHRRLAQLTERVRADIEPFLRRRAAEMDSPRPTPTWTSRSQPEAIVDYSAGLARELLAREQGGPAPTTTKELELARTQPGLR